MSTETYMKLAVSLMVNAVLFGTGATIVLAVPSLAARAAILLPAVIVASILLSIPVSAYIAPRLRLRYQRSLAARRQL